MSTFKGSLSSRLQENHQFFSKNKFLESIGLCSFTKSSCEIIYKQNRKLLNNSSTFDSLPNELSSNTTILDLLSDLQCTYTSFNVGSQTFDASPTSMPLLDLYTLITYHEGRIFNPSATTQDETSDNKIKDINNSLEKSIKCVGKLILGQLEEEVVIDLIFQERGNRSNERSVAFKEIMIAAPPKMASGQQYGYGTTNEHQRSSIDNINTVIPAIQGGFGQDSVAAPLKTYYDNNTGQWKAGNIQILARILEDIQPASPEPIADLNLNSLSQEELNSRLSKFTVGKALPLSMQGGNPNTYGPNFIECITKNSVEVKIVNRSQKSFKKDETVMLTEINGEWIPQPFGEDQPISSPLKFGDWSFVKLIANTDSYFKDDRFYSTGGTEFANDIKPEDYEKASRLKFYTNILSTWSNRKGFIEDNIKRPALTTVYPGSLLREIQQLNLKNIESTNFIPSKRYYICSIFDQLDEKIGGFQKKTILTSTNIEAKNTFISENDQFKYAEEIPLFWGPVYLDGVTDIIYNNNPLPEYTGPDKNFSQICEFFKLPTSSDNNDILSSFPASDNRDNEQLLHVPAECVSKFINPYSVFIGWPLLGSENFTIYTPHVPAPYYGTSTPKSKNRIQFSPLQAEFAGGDDILSKFATDTISRNFYDIVRRLINKRTGTGLIIPSNFNGSLMGKTYERSSALGYFEANRFISLTDLNDTKEPTCGLIYDISQYNALPAFKTIRYQCYVAQQPIDTGLVGAPRLFRDGFSSSAVGAQCVGIISAKNTISKSGGGKINYSLVQDFGLNQQRTSTVAQNTFSLVMGIAFGGSSGGIQTGVPQWGSNTDTIDSFGTTALHVKIYDYWPEEQTLFDPRYFGVLHFNSGSYWNTESLNNTLAIVAGETTQQTQQRIENSKKLDLPIPTYSNDNIVKVGELINRNTTFKPKNQWQLNPIRRGALLTGGGFSYKYHVVGLSDDYAKLSGGTGFTSSFEHIIPSRNLKMTILVDSGSVVGIKFEKDTFGNDMRGDDFLPSDFNTSFPKYDENGNINGTTGDKGFVLNFRSPTPNGKQASIGFENGICWLKIAKDLPPVQHGPITRLTSSSKRGEGFIEETRDTSLDLGSNSSGKYDCFYHFHNDITHTLILAQPFTAGFAQYVSMTIT
jgi:hypothetical protein